MALQLPKAGVILIYYYWGCPAGGRVPHGTCFLALGFALQPVSYSLQSRQRSPNVPIPTPAPLMDVPSVKTGQQLYTLSNTSSSQRNVGLTCQPTAQPPWPPCMQSHWKLRTWKTAGSASMTARWLMLRTSGGRWPWQSAFRHCGTRQVGRGSTVEPGR